MQVPPLILIGIVLHGAAATRECNFHNFVFHGAKKCYELLNYSNLASAVSFTPNITSAVWDILNLVGYMYSVDADGRYRVSVVDERANYIYNDTILPEIFYSESVRLYLDIPSIIQYGPTTEPYLAFVIADLIGGFGLTQNDLEKLKLPAVLADKAKLMNLYENYFKLFCSQNSEKLLLACMTDWMSKTCNSVEDKTEVMSSILSTKADYYCESSNDWKTSVKQKLDSDMGLVYAEVAKYFGIYKDASNEFVFNISHNSVFVNETTMQLLTKLWERKCVYTTDSYHEEIDLHIHTNSTVGAGEIIERLKRMGALLLACSMSVWNEFDSSFMKNHAKIVDHVQFVIKRYSLSDRTLNKTNLGGERATVVVYGDPHMITYKSRKPVTCSALGDSIYLANTFFEMKGYATPVCWSCSATYVTQVHVKFQNGISYAASEHLSTNLINDKPSGNIRIENFGGSVKITDMNSGAVFLLAQYRHTYMITVRMARDLFERSYGLLINGCHNALNISTHTGTRKKRDTCSDACSTAPEELKETCIFDCTLTNDTDVVQISRKIETLQVDITKEDEKIRAALYIEPVVVNVNRNTGITASSSLAAIIPMIISYYKFQF